MRPTENDAELTMREFGWIAVTEILEDTEPPIVAAFRNLDPIGDGRWEVFLDELRGGSITYFNPDDGAFDHAKTWEDLAAARGHRVYGPAWRIPEQLKDTAAGRFAVALREKFADRRELPTGHRTEFNCLRDGVLTLNPGTAVHHDFLVDPGGEERRWFEANLQVYGLEASVYLEGGPTHITPVK